ncbi:MAG TPA: FIST N-terminal domain-containing protein [Pilimelia sp.]|nr:FIST N-terminal domain-containing protein [Pilimelia sp.]
MDDPGDPGRRRWLSVGWSADEDPRRAGAAAAGRAVDDSAPCLLIVFCAASRDPEAVLKGVNSAAGGAQVVGCSSRVVITPDGPDRNGVVAVALGGPGFSIATEVADSAAGHQRQAGTRVAACATQVEDRPHRALVLLSDGLVFRQEELLAGAYGVVGASLPLVGGTASPDGHGRPTFHFHGDRVYHDAVVGVAIASDGPLGIGLRHGWRKVGDPMIVTRSVDGDVFTLNDQPALAAYLKQLGAPAATYTDAVAFDAFSRPRPIGVRRRSGEEVRNVSSTALFSQGWLRSGGDVPEGGLVWMMEGDQQSVLAAADHACQDAIDALDGSPALGLLAFDCDSRADLLGEDGMRQEVSRMAGRTGGAPVAGLYTWGEIARVRGINGYHNQTLAVLAVG